MIARPADRASAPLSRARAGARRLLERAGLRSPALAWRGRGDAAPDGGRREDAAEAGRVDVIVPVHGAADEFRRCLASVAAWTDLGLHRLVVVLDGPGQREAEDALAGLAPRAGEGLLVLENAERRGFAASVNRGLGASRRDVVLLNSDAVVTERWLDKLQAAAYAAPDVATVTPFSNDATICSIPRPLTANAIPSGHDVDSFARLVEASSAREYPRLPTGVGFCLYVKRRVLDAIGPLDAGEFGLGYGEETEFCVRALKAGYVHVLDDATFVHHAGQRSFGASRAARVRAGERRMRRRHPEYRATVARFVAEDPLRPARERVLRALDPPGGAVRGAARLSVLHVVHGWPPYARTGVETYARELAQRQTGRWQVAAYARMADPRRELGDATELSDRGVRVRLAVNNFTQRNPLSRNALRSRALESDFSRMLRETRPDIVHVHHLAGHAAGLVGAAIRHGAPVVYHAHDWWAACGRSNFLARGGDVCSGPAPDKCARCLPLTRAPAAALWNRALHAYRASLAARAISRADAVVMGSRFIEESYRALGLLPAAGPPVYLLPYGVSLGSGDRAREAPGAPLRFGIVASIMPHKGLHVAAEAFGEMSPERASLQIWGDVSIAPAYAAALRAAAPHAVFRGNFREEDKDAVYAGIDVLIVPSVGLESFGLVAREAMARGVPVLASRRGALAEAFEDGVAGAYFPPGDAGALRRLIERMSADPAIVAGWARRLPRVKGMDAHAAEIERVYRDVLVWRGVIGR